MISKKETSRLSNFWSWASRLQVKFYVIPVLLLTFGLCLTYAFETLYYQHRQQERSYEVVQGVLKSSRQDLETFLAKYGDLAKLIDIAAIGHFSASEFEVKYRPFTKTTADDGLQIGRAHV